MAGKSEQTRRLWVRVVKGEDLRSSTSVLVDDDWVIDQVVDAGLRKEVLSGTVAPGKVKVMLGDEAVPRDALVGDCKTTYSNPLLLVVEEEGEGETGTTGPLPKKPKLAQAPSFEEDQVLRQQESYLQKFEKDLPRYVHRECCPIDSTLKSLHEGEVLAFVGPSGSGKTTTLRKLWCTEKANKGKEEVLFLDCATVVDKKNACLSNKRFSAAYYFVDNAQKLKSLPFTTGVLMTASGVCLAFSSLVDDEGCSVVRCPIKYTRLTYFTPFTDKELEEYTRNVNFKFCNEARNLGVLLPGVLRVAEGAANSSRARREMDYKMVACLRHTWQRVTNKALDFSICQLVNLVLLGEKQLEEITQVTLVNSGICYLDRDKKVKSPFPLSCILSACYGYITSVYNTVLRYDTGAAVEFLFAIQALSVGITVGLKAQKPIRLEPSLYVHQTEAGVPCADSVLYKSGTILIKLVKKHPAVDFLIIDNPAGKASKKLFLVQVSAKMYQSRGEEHRCQAIKWHFSTYECFKEESPLDVYSRKTDVLRTNCHFVYASTTDSMVNEKDAPFVYLCKLKPNYFI